MSVDDKALTVKAMVKPSLIQCDVREATHVMGIDGSVYKIASKWGIDENGSFVKGGFGVVTESGMRIDMLNAKLYLRDPQIKDVLTKARELYEEARDHVAGRPKWEDLDQDDPYDMGMRDTAVQEARKALGVS